MENKQILFLNEAEVGQYVPYEKVLELVEKSFKEYSLGQAVNPIMLHLPIYPDYEGYINSMPAYLRKDKIAGAKIVSVYKNNMSQYQMPSTIIDGDKAHIVLSEYLYRVSDLEMIAPPLGRVFHNADLTKFSAIPYRI